MAVQYCNYDIKGTLAVTGTSTFTGAATFGSSINMSDNQPINFGGQTMFTHTGSITRIGDNSSSSVLSISSGTATFTGSVIAPNVFTQNVYITSSGTSQTNRIDNDGTQLYLTYGGGTDRALEILNSNGDAHFTGNVEVGDGTDIAMSSAVNGQLKIDGLGYDAAIALDDTAMRIYHNSSIRDLVLGTNETARLTIAGSSGNATFAGDITVSGGDITLGGSTGRIQGIDTVSATTDAANKAYVDNAVSTGVGAYLPLTGGVLTGNVRWNDAKAALFGSGQDMHIYHYQNENYIDTYKGHLYLSVYENDKDIILRSDNGSGGIADYLIIDGSEVSIRMKRKTKWDDSIQATFGDGEDLKIYHDGSHSYIEDSGSGNLKIRTNGLNIMNAANSEIMLSATQDGSVNLYYNNSEKLKTTNAGITVTGGGTFSTSVTASGNSNTFGNTTIAALSATSGSFSASVTAAGNSNSFGATTFAGNIAMGDNDITGIDQLTFSSGTFLTDVSSNYLELRYASTASGGIIVLDGDGTTQGYLYADGNATSSFGLLDGSGSWAVRCVEDQYVELRYDNSTKFRTASTGINVTGAGNFTGNIVANDGISGQITISPNNINSNNNLILGTSGANIEMYTNGQAYYDAVSHNFRDSDASPTYFSITASQVNSFVKLSVASNKIIDLATPTISTDAANKAYVDAQIQTIPSGLNFQGNWNANTNSPTLASGTGTPGFYYNVSVAGSTNLDGETDWQVGDWAVFVENGANDFWEKIDNTSALTGVGANSQLAIWGGTNTLEGTTALTFTGGHLYVTGDGNSSNWYSAYQDTITAFSDSGSSTITLTLTQRDGGTLTTSFSNPQGTVTGTGANNRIALWNGTTGIDSNENLSISGNDLAIGTQAGTTTARLLLYGTAANNGPSVIKTTNGNLHIDSDDGHTVYINYYTGTDTGSSLVIGNGASGTSGTFFQATGDATIGDELTITTIANATSNTDKFLVSDSGKIKYRTGAQVLSDIGGAPATGGAYLPLAGGTMTTTAKIKFYNANQYIHANSSNDLTIASADDINYLSNFNRFYTSGLEFARLSGSNDSWIANGTNSKLGVNKSSGINYNLDVEGTFGTTGAITIGGNATFNGAQVTFNPDADSSLRILNAGTDAVAVFAGTGDVLYLGGNNTTGMYLDQAANAVFSGNLYIPEYIYHSGDTNTYIRFTADTQTFRTGGADRLTLTNSGAVFTVDVTTTKLKMGNTQLYPSGDQNHIHMIATALIPTDTTFSNNPNIGTSTYPFNIVTAGKGRFISDGDASLSSTAHAFQTGLTSSTNIIIDNNEVMARNNGAVANLNFNPDGGTVSFHNNGNSSTITAAGNATFAGDLTVSGGDISLGSGTGRIQGIDTVTDGTDAANKDYVDTAVGAVPVGTVTSVSSSTTSQLTVSQSSPAPALSIVTAAVTNGGTALATGNQIYDWGVAAFAPIVSGGYLPLSGGTMTGTTNHNDNVYSRWGTGGDLRLWHNGTNSYVFNYGGNLYIGTGDANKHTVFLGDDGSGGETEYLRIDGQYEQLYLRKDMQVSDGKKIMFGDTTQQNGDLQIYHDGSNSYIRDQGVGNLIITGSQLTFSNVLDTEYMAKMVQDGTVELYYNGSKKFETTSTGVAIPSGQSVDFINSNLGYNAIKRNSTLGGLEIRTGNVASINILDNSNATFAGDIVLGASSSIVLDDTPTASTASGSGTIVNWSVSTSVSAGTLYVVKSDGGWTTADADSEAKSTAMAAIALGSNATAGMLLQGFFYKSSHGFAIGSPLYISNTAGAFSNTRPTGTGDYVRIIGYATSTNYIYFDPDKTWVKID